MELEDRITIHTPEGISLEMTLAGLGSRAAASLLDTLIKGAILLVVLLFSWFLSGFGDDTSTVATALVAVVAFVLFFGYDVAFETMNSGRTPGKRATGIKVVSEGGGQVQFTASAVRNIIRIVDLLPGFYFVGLVAIIAGRHNQRLGDIAASTLVVRDRKAAGGASIPSSVPSDASSGPPWDVTAVTQQEVAVVRQFLERRAELDVETRRRISVAIAGPLRAKVVGPGPDLDAERFLERLAAEKASRG